MALGVGFSTLVGTSSRDAAVEVQANTGNITRCLWP